MGDEARTTRERGSDNVSGKEWQAIRCRSCYGYGDDIHATMSTVAAGYDRLSMHFDGGLGFSVGYGVNDHVLHLGELRQRMAALKRRLD